MPFYDYMLPETGERMEVFGSMRDPPPERYRYAGKEWHRVYAGGVSFKINDAGGVRNPGYVSMSLLERDTSEGVPFTDHGRELLKYKDGAVTDMSGAWIIRDKSDARRAEDYTGTKRET